MPQLETHVFRAELVSEANNLKRTYQDHPERLVTQ